VGGDIGLARRLEEDDHVWQISVGERAQ
jgi:hypothetical protein